MIIDEIKQWIIHRIRFLPGRFGMWLRSKHIKWVSKGAGNVATMPGCYFTGLKNMKLGDRLAFGINCTVTSVNGKLTIGSQSAFNSNVFLGADFGTIEIGDSVLVGPNVVMRAANHSSDTIDETQNRGRGHVSGHIKIGKNVWIGANAVIVPGADIGDNCVIGAGAVVNSTIPQKSLAVGVPAKVLRQL
jgi:acetyltransferase-like isoleucine patch superfamily enzyme